MGSVDFRSIILVGLAICFVPLMVVGLGSVDVAWETVASSLTYPFLLLFLIGIVAILIWRR